MDAIIEDIANGISQEIEIVRNHDLTLVVADALKIHVSSDVMREASTMFRRMLIPGFKEGSDFAVHKAKKPKVPFLMPLKHDGRMGMKLYCAALHENLELIYDIDSESLLSFANTADKYNGLAQVKKGAELAIKSIQFETNVDTVLRASFLFGHVEYFSKLTEWMVKYRQMCFSDLQNLVLEPKIR